VLGSTTNYEHTYAGKRHLGNIDVTNQQQPVNGKVWRWEGGAGTPSADPIEAPQRSSASGTQYYMLNDERTIEKRSYQVGGVVAGDTNDDSRYAEWQHVNGAPIPTRVQIGVPSELFSAYNITLDADRASSAATNHALQLGATDLEYEVTRVKSPVLGRDMNPMGRGDGTYYANGGNYADSANVVVLGTKPAFIGTMAYGYGSSVNNTYSPEECQKLRNEQLRRLEEDPACKKEIGLDPNVCCITECGVGLPEGEEKDRLRRSCDCCCCLAKGCPPCLYPLPAECIFCCTPNVEPCECMPTQVSGCPSCGTSLGPPRILTPRPYGRFMFEVSWPGMFFTPQISLMVGRKPSATPLTMVPLIPFIKCPRGYRAQCEYAGMFFGIPWWQCWCVPKSLPKPPGEEDEWDPGDTTGLKQVGYSSWWRCMQEYGWTFATEVGALEILYSCVLKCSGYLWPIWLSAGRGGTLDTIKASGHYASYVTCMTPCLGCWWPVIGTAPLAAAALCAIQTGVFD